MAFLSANDGYLVSVFNATRELHKPRGSAAETTMNHSPSTLVPQFILRTDAESPASRSPWAFSDGALVFAEDRTKQQPWLWGRDACSGGLSEIPIPTDGGNRRADPGDRGIRRLFDVGNVDLGPWQKLIASKRSLRAVAALVHTWDDYAGWGIDRSVSRLALGEA